MKIVKQTKKGFHWWFKSGRKEFSTDRQSFAFYSSNNNKKHYDILAYLIK